MGEIGILIYDDRIRFDFGWWTLVQYTDLSYNIETHMVMLINVTPKNFKKSTKLKNIFKKNVKYTKF